MRNAEELKKYKELLDAGVIYSYYRKTSSEAAISNAMWGFDYKPGIYCNRYGDECVFECPN